MLGRLPTEGQYVPRGGGTSTEGAGEKHSPGTCRPATCPPLPAFPGGGLVCRDTAGLPNAALLLRDAGRIQAGRMPPREPAPPGHTAPRSSPSTAAKYCPAQSAIAARLVDGGRGAPSGRRTGGASMAARRGALALWACLLAVAALAPPGAQGLGEHWAGLNTRDTHAQAVSLAKVRPGCSGTAGLRAGEEGRGGGFPPDRSEEAGDPAAQANPVAGFAAWVEHMQRSYTDNVEVRASPRRPSGLCLPGLFFSQTAWSSVVRAWLVVLCRSISAASRCGWTTSTSCTTTTHSGTRPSGCEAQGYDSCCPAPLRSKGGTGACTAAGLLTGSACGPRSWA